MPLKFNQTKCNAVKFNNTTLSVIKFNGTNVFKSGNVVFKYNLTSQNAGLNGYAPDFYITLKNQRTGVTKTVGGSIGTTSVSLPAIDGDKIIIQAHGYYEGGNLSPQSPLQNGIYENDNYIIYPLNTTDIQFTANLVIRGQYNPDSQRWIPYESVNGTVTANYYIKIESEGDY